MLENCRKETKEAIDNILSCFSGEAGGGGKFVTLCCLVDELDVRAQNGDRAAEQLVSIARQFSRLIDTADDLASKRIVPPKLDN
jgi:hypothetical protein